MTLVAIVYIQFAPFTVWIPSETNHVCPRMIPYNARGKSASNQTYKYQMVAFLSVLSCFRRLYWKPRRRVPYKTW